MGSVLQLRGARISGGGEREDVNAFIWFILSSFLDLH